jgi:uncharacterized protein
MPPPVVGLINEGMWRAAAEGRLAVQRCQSCAAHRYPPADGCYRCGSLDWDWADLPGTGVIYTYIWIPDRTRSAEQGREVLYNVAVVTVDGTEGDPVRILTNVVDAWLPDDLQVGQAVELSPVAFEAGLALPCFRRVAP